MKGLHRQMLMIATKTGWTRAEILALPASEFGFYVRELIHTTDADEE